MSSIEQISPLEREAIILWRKYLWDSVLALLGVMGVTAILFFFHLYPRIPNISIVYLLVVLPFATIRGRYCAIVAGVLSFLAFDFFMVPPLYTFTMENPDEWIALCIFLLDALLTGYLASTLRQRAEEASRRERETRALYHLWRITSREEKPEGQLQAMSRAVVEIFAPWGVQECALLQFDSAGVLQVQASAAQHQPSLFGFERPDGSIPPFRQSGSLSGEKDTLPLLAFFTWVKNTFHLTRPRTEVAPGRSFHLLSLKLGQKTVGALRLAVLGDPRPLLQEEHLEDEDLFTESSSFFSTFLSQVAALLERARLQQENLRMEILQRTDTLRSALLSSVSHDLRTPLTTIKAAASTLLQRDVQWDEEARRGFLQSIEQEADRLNRLVANLLDMSRIEEGALKPDKDWYSVKALLQDVVGRMTPLLEKRLVQLHLPDDLLLAELDYLMIDQVMTNLIENVLRYTPEASPLEIDAHLEGEQVLVSVADRGPGLSLDQLEHVFDKFYRVMHNHPTSGGSGLGLTVCRGLVEAHGGRIWAEQRDGGGLVMHVVLPIGATERMPV